MCSVVVKDLRLKDKDLWLKDKDLRLKGKDLRLKDLLTYIYRFVAAISWIMT